MECKINKNSKLLGTTPVYGCSHAIIILYTLYAGLHASYIQIGVSNSAKIRIEMHLKRYTYKINTDIFYIDFIVFCIGIAKQNLI